MSRSGIQLRWPALAVVGGIASFAAPLWLAAAVSTTAAQQTPSSGETLFKTRCAGCHEPAVGRAPDRARLSQLGALEIFNALKNGSMRAMAAGLGDADLGAIATYVSPPPKTPVAAAPPMSDPPKCPGAGRFALGRSDWNGWGRNLSNWRSQPDPGFTRAAAPKLAVKWAFAFDGGKYGQPTVAGGRVFLTSLAGKAYALDAKTGCMHWRFNGAPSRTTAIVGRLSAAPSGYAVYFGGQGGVVYALDAGDGRLIWKTTVETHPFAILTGAAVLYRDRLYVPLSSFEELSGFMPTHPCCTFRGGVVALDAATGKIAWKTNTIAAAPAPSHKNSAGEQMYGPAGAAVWSAPTIDARRNLILVATGDSYTDVKEEGSDAVVAMDLTTGRIRWATQVTHDDNYLSGCTPERPMAKCPRPLGHDFDFGAPPILLTLPGGGDVLVAGQKSGVVTAMSPDTGKIIWQAKVSEGGPLGGVEWGMASDGKRLYVANADAFMPSPPGRPGLVALDPASGKQLWSTPSPHLQCGWTHGAICLTGLSAPPTVVPGAVFAGDMNGRLRAYSAQDGKVVWEFDTGARTYPTVNGAAAAGGNLDGPGPVIADGMLYVVSGYQGSLDLLSGAAPPTSVLLAFSVDGR